jgi:hypothetical protein
MGPDEKKVTPRARAPQTNICERLFRAPESPTAASCG